MCKIFTLSKNCICFWCNKWHSSFLYGANCWMGKDGHWLKNHISNCTIRINMHSVKERGIVLWEINHSQSMHLLCVFCVSGTTIPCGCRSEPKITLSYGEDNSLIRYIRKGPPWERIIKLKFERRGGYNQMKGMGLWK